MECASLFIALIATLSIKVLGLVAYGLPTLLDAGYRNVDATGTASDVKQVFAGVRFAF